MANQREDGGRMGELIAVAVDKDRGSQNALKWAIDHVEHRLSTVILVHVKQRAPGSPMAESDELNIRRELDRETAALFQPFQCYCIRRAVDYKVILLEDPDVARALIEFVSSYGVKKLVLGTTSRSSFSKIFKGTHIPSLVRKWAPEFCDVYVISKTRATTVRTSSRRAPSFMVTDRTPFAAHDMIDYTESMIPFSRVQEVDNMSPDELPSPETSFLSSERISTDSTFASFYDKLGSKLDGQASEDSDSDSDDFEALDAPSKCSVAVSSSKELPSNNKYCGRVSRLKFDDDVDNMNWLDSEPKQIADMCHLFSEEVPAARKKVKKPSNRKREARQTLKRLEMSEDEAFSILQNEKAKCMAAVEASEAAKWFAKLEMEKRVAAEVRAVKETEEKKQLLKALDHSKMVVRCQIIFLILAALFLMYFSVVEQKFFKFN